MSAYDHREMRKLKTYVLFVCKYIACSRLVYILYWDIIFVAISTAPKQLYPFNLI